MGKACGNPSAPELSCLANPLRRIGIPQEQTVQEKSGCPGYWANDTGQMLFPAPLEGRNQSIHPGI